MKRIIAAILLCLYPMQPCLGDTTEKVELAAMEFPSQQAEMNCYLAVVEGQLDMNDEWESFVKDFHYVYALRRGKTAKQDQIRVELISSSDSVDGTVFKKCFRKLKTAEHFFQDLDGDGRFSDFIEELKERPEMDDNAWDPFTMPINYFVSYNSSSPTHYRDITKYIMPVGQLLNAEIDQLENRIGRWRHGHPRELGYTEVVFDPDVGNMPVLMRMRNLKQGVETVDIDDPVGCTKLYQQNETKWVRHHSGKFLPEVVKCIKTINGTSAWQLKISWWLDDEVPDEVFELDDLLKAHVNGSIIDTLVEERADKVASGKKAASESP